MVWSVVSLSLSLSLTLLTVMTQDEALQELIILRQQIAELRSTTSTDARGCLLPGLSLPPSIQFAGSESLKTMSLPELSEAFELSENLVSTIRDNFCIFLSSLPTNFKYSSCFYVFACPTEISYVTYYKQ
jgi:hypothetical protein